jgi:hypothetical protein
MTDRLKRKLDEVETLYSGDPKKMALLHSGDGYYRENQNPYSIHTREWNMYENEFLNIELRRVNE